VRQLDRAFPDFARVQGLVLDLRNATTGRTEFAYQMLARLSDRPLTAVRWRTPQYRAVFRALNLADSALTWYGPDSGTVAPRIDHPSYGGPMAVLISSATSGAAEDLVAVFRAAGRGPVIGEPSGGSPGDVGTFTLPKSWSVQFSVTRHRSPDGTEFAGAGVKPDVLVVPTVNDLVTGHDVALEKAREYLEGGRGR
jgi:C-terminal processing protease CtpA/Prc